jgi:hypothetical protein
LIETYIVAPPDGSRPGAGNTTALARSWTIGRLAWDLVEVVDPLTDPKFVGLGPDPALDGASLTGRFVDVNASRGHGGGHGGGGNRQVGGRLSENGRGASLVAILTNSVIASHIEDFGVFIWLTGWEEGSQAKSG